MDFRILFFSATSVIPPAGLIWILKRYPDLGKRNLPLFDLQDEALRVVESSKVVITTLIFPRAHLTLQILLTTMHKNVPLDKTGEQCTK